VNDAPAPAAKPPMRIAIVCEHASAKFGGEAALPLHYFRVLRRLGHAVWLVTHARTRSELQALFPEETRILYVEDTLFHRLMFRIGERLPARIAYFSVGLASRIAVQITQRRWVRRLVAEERIEVVHQPMPVSPREPSLMFGLGAPVVIGPMNGGMQYPPAFRRGRPAQRFLRAAARGISELLNGILPGKREAALVLVANARTRAALPRAIRGRIVELVENGVDLEVFRPAGAGAASIELVEAAGRPFKGTAFVFVGRLVDWKRVDLLLRAFAQAAQRASLRLLVVGSGPEELALRTLAAELGIVAPDERSPGIEFAGWLTQRECADRIAASDGLVLSSIFECGGAVVLEAMAMSKPVIATAWGGPLDYLDPSCGILVPADGALPLQHALGAAMVRLALDPQARVRMGKAGRAKVLRDYDWDVKIARILEIYVDARRSRSLSDSSSLQ
jgi:glycosyltransferase involved in cell wall biosynthesis